MKGMAMRIIKALAVLGSIAITAFVFGSGNGGGIGRASGVGNGGGHALAEFVKGNKAEYIRGARAESIRGGRALCGGHGSGGGNRIDAVVLGGHGNGGGNRAQSAAPVFEFVKGSRAVCEKVRGGRAEHSALFENIRGGGAVCERIRGGKSEHMHGGRALEGDAFGGHGTSVGNFVTITQVV